MRRMLLLAVTTLMAFGIAPAMADAPVGGELCGDLLVVINGETHVDEHRCLPPDGDPPALPDLPALPELPAPPELPALPEPPGVPEPGGPPDLPALPI